MKNYSLTIGKMIGEKKYMELILFTIKKLLENKEKIKTNEILEAMYFNHHSLLFIATQKSQGIKNQEIEKSLNWKKSQKYKYILAKNVDDFCLLFQEYIDAIIDFIKRK